jgi:ABC-2 type transport system permease protein
VIDPLRIAREALAVAEVEARKLARDPTEVFTRAVQPVLWLAVFGQVFGRLRQLPTGGLDYLAFMTPGVLAQSVLFSAIFYGIAVIWERDLGIVHRTLVSPAARTSLVLGKALFAGLRGLTQAVVVYLVALALGVHLRLGVGPLLAVSGLVGLGSAVFSTFSLVIACLVKTRERFMGIGQLMTMPLFFASNAIYPMELMPRWLQVVARVNPLSYLVDALRTLMLEQAPHGFGLGVDVAVEGGAFVALLALAVRLYPTLVQ